MNPLYFPFLVSLFSFTYLYYLKTRNKKKPSYFNVFSSGPHEQILKKTILIIVLIMSVLFFSSQLLFRNQPYFLIAGILTTLFLLKITQPFLFKNSDNNQDTSLNNQANFSPKQAFNLATVITLLCSNILIFAITILCFFSQPTDFTLFKNLSAVLKATCLAYFLTIILLFALSTSSFRQYTNKKQISIFQFFAIHLLVYVVLVVLFSKLWMPTLRQTIPFSLSILALSNLAVIFTTLWAKITSFPLKKTFLFQTLALFFIFLIFASYLLFKNFVLFPVFNSLKLYFAYLLGLAQILIISPIISLTLNYFRIYQGEGDYRKRIIENVQRLIIFSLMVVGTIISFFLAQTYASAVFILGLLTATQMIFLLNFFLLLIKPESYETKELYFRDLRLLLREDLFIVFSLFLLFLMSYFIFSSLNIERYWHELINNPLFYIFIFLSSFLLGFFILLLIFWIMGGVKLKERSELENERGGEKFNFLKTKRFIEWTFLFFLFYFPIFFHKFLKEFFSLEMLLVLGGFLFSGFFWFFLLRFSLKKGGVIQKGLNYLRLKRLEQAFANVPLQIKDLVIISFLAVLTIFSTSFY